MEMKAETLFKFCYYLVFSIRFLFLIFISYFLLHTMTQIPVYLGVYHELLLLSLQVLDCRHRMSLSFVLHFQLYHLQ